MSSLVLLLAVLALLQVRWLRQKSEAERERTRWVLGAGLFLTSNEVDLTLAALYQTFDLEIGWCRTAPQRLAEAHADWTGQTANPALIAAIFGLCPDDAGIVRPLRLETETGALVATDTEHLIARLDQRSPASPWLAGEPPALLIPSRAAHYEHPGAAGPGPASGSSDRATAEEGRVATGVVVVLDPKVLVEDVLPALLLRSFFDRFDEFEIAVVSGKAGAEEVLYRSPDDLAVELIRFERRAPLLGLRYARQALPVAMRNEQALAGRWQLLARLQAGTVDAAYRRLERRNLVLSLGVLVLLAAAATVLVLSARRERRLARRQLDFVAGVTHELRTPLAVVSSAGGNLADGLVTEIAQARRYGEVIQRECRRLQTLVDNVLRFAGLRAVGKGPPPRPVEVAKAVAQALEALTAEIDSRNGQVRVEVAADTPPAAIDPGALTAALANLIGNAIKHCPPAQTPRIDVVGRRAADGRVEITVRDHGPGIPQAELRHLFEPFFRGTSARQGQVRGSGLGLALVRTDVERYGGEVRVGSRLGAGSSFTLRLLAATATSAPEAGGAAVSEAMR